MPPSSARDGRPSGAGPGRWTRRCATAAPAIADDAGEVIRSGGVDVVVDATGNPGAGIRHVLACCDAGKDVVMVNVEADALAGPILAERARSAGVVYSLAYGDQPALVCELVDWARAAGFEVVAAGKGTRYLPRFHLSTPDTVWADYGISPEAARSGRLNPRMFNSFLDGTKSAIEMAAVANATGLGVPPGGLAFPPCGADDLPRVLRPRTAGGVLDGSGLGRGGIEPRPRRHAGSARPALGRLRRPRGRDALRRACFREYGVVTDESGRYAAMYRPLHLIGLELGISIASVALRREPTGAPRGFHADVVAVAKRDLRAGEVLDGEGGHRVWGRLAPAADSVRSSALPIGLAHGARLRADVAAGATVRWADVVVDETSEPVRIRRALEERFAVRRQADALS